MKMMFIQVNNIKKSLYTLFICLNRSKLHYRFLSLKKINIVVNNEAFIFHNI